MMSSKRPKLSSQETRKIRKILNEEARLGLNTNSDSETEEVDLKKEIYPIGHFINDREEMVEQMFSLIKGPKLDRMLPPILKDMPLDELKADCLIHLLGMSKKRILAVLDGKEINSSSESELEPENSPSPKKKKKSRFTPMIIKQEGCSDISDNSEEVVLVDPDLEDEIVSKPKSKKQSKNEETKNSKKTKKRKSLPEKNKSKATKTLPVKPEKHVASSPAQEISSDNEAQANPEAPREGKTLLEILELEMRARAIRALLTKGDNTVTVSEESTSKVPSIAVTENEVEGTDSNKVTPTKNFRIQNKDKSDDIILVSPKVVTIDLTDETEASSTKKVIDAEHQIEELDNLLSSVECEQGEMQLNKSKNQPNNKVTENNVSKEQVENDENSNIYDQTKENKITDAKEQAQSSDISPGKEDNISPTEENADQIQISSIKEKAKTNDNLSSEEQAKVNKVSACNEQAESNEISAMEEVGNDVITPKEQTEVNEISDTEDKSPSIIDEIVLIENNTSESEEGEISDEDEVISIPDSPKNDQTKIGEETQAADTEEQKSNWAQRWLESDKVKNVVKTSKICGTIRKRIKNAKLAKKNEPAKIEEPTINPLPLQIEGRVEEYALLTKSQANLAGGHAGKSEEKPEANGMGDSIDQQESSIEQVQDVSSTKVDIVNDKGLDGSDNVGPNETIDSALGTSVNSSDQSISSVIECSGNDVLVDSTLSTQSSTSLGIKESSEESQTVDETINSTNENLSLDTSEDKENVISVPEPEIEMNKPLSTVDDLNNSTTDKVEQEVVVTSFSSTGAYQSPLQLDNQVSDLIECDSKEVSQTSNKAECDEIFEKSSSETKIEEISQNKEIKSSVVEEVVDCNEPETLEISIDDGDTDFE